MESKLNKYVSKIAKYCPNYSRKYEDLFKVDGLVDTQQYLKYTNIDKFIIPRVNNRSYQIISPLHSWMDLDRMYYDEQVESDSDESANFKKYEFSQLEGLPKDIRMFLFFREDLERDFSILSIMNERTKFDERDGINNKDLIRNDILGVDQKNHILSLMSDFTVYLQDNYTEHVSYSKYVFFLISFLLKRNNNVFYYKNGCYNINYLVSFGELNLVIPIRECDINIKAIRSAVNGITTQKVTMFERNLETTLNPRRYPLDEENSYVDYHEAGKNIGGYRDNLYHYCSDIDLALLYAMHMKNKDLQKIDPTLEIEHTRFGKILRKKENTIEVSGHTAAIYVYNNTQFLRCVENNNLTRNYPIVTSSIDLKGTGIVSLNSTITHDLCGQLLRELVLSVIDDKSTYIQTQSDWTDTSVTIKFKWRVSVIQPSGDIEDLISQLDTKDEIKKKKQDKIVSFIRHVTDNTLTQEQLVRKKKYIKTSIKLQNKRLYKMEKQNIIPSGDDDLTVDQIEVNDYESFIENIQEQTQYLEFTKYIDDSMLMVVFKDIYQVLVYGETRDYVNFVINLLAQFKFSPIKIIKQVYQILVKLSTPVAEYFKQVFNLGGTQETQQPNPASSTIVPSGLDYENMIPIIGSILGVGALGIALSVVKENNKVDDKTPFLTSMCKKFIFLGKFKHGLYATLDLLKDFGNMIKDSIKYLCSSNTEELFLDDYFKRMDLNEDLKPYTKDIFKYVRDYTDISKFPEYEQKQTEVVKILRDVTYIMHKALELNSNKEKSVLKTSHLDIIKLALRDMREMLKKFEESPVYKPFRHTPYWLYLWGGAGVGKSAFLSWLSQTLHSTLLTLEEKRFGLGYFKLHHIDNFFYAKNASDPFYSGYKQQDVLAMDDIFQDKEGVTAVNTRMEVINIISNILLIPNMPGLNDKGKSMEPKIFITTSNVFGTNMSKNSINVEEALLSRRNLIIYLDKSDRMDETYGHKVDFYLHTDSLNAPRDLKTNKISAMDLLNFIVTDYIRHWEEQMAIEKSRKVDLSQITRSTDKILEHYDKIKNIKREQTRDTKDFQQHMYNTMFFRKDTTEPSGENNIIPSGEPTLHDDFVNDAFNAPYENGRTKPFFGHLNDNTLYGWFNQFKSGYISKDMFHQFILMITGYSLMGYFFGFLKPLFGMSVLNNICNFIRGERNFRNEALFAVRNGVIRDQKYCWYGMWDKITNFHVNFHKVIFDYIKKEYAYIVKFLFFLVAAIFVTRLVYKLYNKHNNNEVSGRYDHNSKHVAKQNIVISGISNRTEQVLTTLYGRSTQVIIKGAMTMNAVRLTGKILLVPYHFFIACQVQNINKFTIAMESNNGTLVKEEIIDENNIVRWKQSDVCIYKLSKTHLDAKSIVSMFAKNSHLVTDSVQAISNYKYPNNERITGINVEAISNNNYLDPSGSVEYKHSLIYNTDGYAVKGHSGGLLFLSNPKSDYVILGMQTAIDPTYNKSFFVPITQDMLNEMMSRFDSSIEVSGVYDFEWMYEKMISHTDIRENDGREHALIYIGDTNKNYTVTQSPVTSYVASIGFEEFSKDTTKEPAPLTPNDSRITEELRGQDLIKRGMKGFDDRMGAVDPVILNSCIRELSEYYIRTTNREYKPQRVLTEYESHNGDGDLILPVEITTSAGLPYCKLPDANGKKMLYNIISNGVDKDMLHPRYNFQEDIDILESKMREGYICSEPAYACLKDECLKKEKVIQGKTRLFYTLPCTFNILCRKYTGSFFANIQSRAGKDFIAVGIDPVKDFSYMAQRLRKFGDNNLWDFDYSEWDKRLCGDFIIGGMDIVNAWYKYFDSTWDSVDDIVRNGIAEYLVNTPIVFRDKLYLKTGGMVSGCAITATMNSLAHTVFLLYVWKKYWTTRDKSKASLEYFNKNVVAYMYGDDFVGSISDEAREFMSDEIIDIIQSLRMNVTTGSKDKNFGLRNYREVEFLKRRFIPHSIDPTKICAQLHKISIINPLVWVHKKDDELDAFLENARGSLREAALHGKIYYDGLKDRIYNVIDGYKRRNPSYSNVVAHFAAFSDMHFELFGFYSNEC